MDCGPGGLVAEDSWWIDFGDLFGLEISRYAWPLNYMLV